VVDRAVAVGANTQAVLDELSSEIDRPSKENAALRQRIQLLTHRLFGRRSEKGVPVVEQGVLPFEPVVAGLIQPETTDASRRDEPAEGAHRRGHHRGAGLRAGVVCDPRDGVQITRRTLSEWNGAVADLLEPIVRAMHREQVCQSPWIQCDDTTLDVQDPSRAPEIRIGHLWVYRGEGGRGGVRLHLDT